MLLSCIYNGKGLCAFLTITDFLLYLPNVLEISGFVSDHCIHRPTPGLKGEYTTAHCHR